jgi:hypothetical protein
MVLAHGLPVVIEVTSESMTPSLDRGTKIKVEPAAGEILPGEIVLILSDAGDATILHRVMHVFWSGGDEFVIHQGDAPTSLFATCPRQAVIGRAAAYAMAPSRPLPIPEPVQADARVRFHRRRRACAVFALGRRVASSLKVAQNPVSRRLARVYRNVARKFAG